MYRNIMALTHTYFHFAKKFSDIRFNIILCMCVCIYIHTYTHTYTHAYIHTHNTYIHTIHTYTQYIHIHTHIHTRIHIYTHTHIFAPSCGMVFKTEFYIDASTQRRRSDVSDTDAHTCNIEIT